ncbi:purine and uridine phosphorylase, partial [Aureobasidium melanogenum]
MGKNKALESSDSYTVGWIAALPKEMAATLGMLDERHDKPKDFVKPSSDTNAYCWGRIGDHNVVIASLAAGVYGTTSAATTAIHMLSSFPSIKVGLMVGIGAAIPGPKHDIRLGDVVVSQPHGQAGGVIQYDLGKSRVRTEHEHTVHTFEKVGVLRPPPEALLKALSLLQAEIRLEGSSIFQFLEEMLERYPRLAQRGPEAPGYIYQGQENDKLFEASYLHTSGVGCDDCDPARMVSRDTRRDPDVPRVHYGVIASGNRLVKDAAERDMILRESGEDCICLETEAAGLLNSFPCLVIRGICDYADSHGNNDWQEYAAATAAAYAKEFLGFLDQGDLARASKASEVLEQISEDLKKMNKTVKIAEEAVQDLQLDYHEKKIGDWLSAPDPSTNYINALEKRHQDTGLWFTRGEVFARWNRQPGSFLWLHGIPGCGKTILSSTIIEHLRCYNKPDQPLLYFYFDFSDSKKQTLENMLRSLTNQLYQGQPEARSPLDQLWESHGYGNQQLSKQSLRTVLPAMLSRVNDPSIVIDALDEASTRSNLLAWLEGICGPGSPVRVLVITRSEEDIERAFEHWTQPEDRIGISESDIDGDIRVYVNHTVRNGSVLDRWQGRPDVQDEIESELVVKANGICGGLTQVVEDLIDKGAKFTEAGDSAAYGYLEEALRLASREGHDTTVQLLLDRGADINAGHGNALRWASLNSNATVVQLLLDRGADANAGHGNALRWASLNGDDKTVQLLLDRGADIDVRGEDQETALTKALNGDHYTTVQLLLENNAFLSLDDFIDALRGDTQRGERLVSIMLPYVTADLAAQEDRKGMNMLHYAAAYGSEATARKCLDLGVDFRVRDYRGMTALDWAANREHLNIVKALVRAGSDLEEVDGYGWTPLEYLADITPRERRARSWERYSERSAESVLDKSERTLLAHAQDDAVHSIGADAPEKREPCSNVVQYPDERAQKGFVAPSVNSLAPSSFRAALEASDVTEAIRLLEEETQAVTQPLSGFEWLEEPLAMGLTPTEIINLIIEERKEAPWIRTRDPIIIGGFHVNQDCPFKKAFDKSMSRLDTASQPHVLGTFSEFWSLREVQYGSQAGQYALVAINMTWIKTDARTIESAVINGDWDLDTLEAPWGLLVSVCTGVAQRVPLREVVAEVMPAMVAAMRRRPQEWELLAQNHNIVEKFKDPTFKTWYNSLKRPEKDALDVVTEYILKKIYWTGVDQREKLVVACPSFGDASGCIHMPREQNQALASILKDSEDCATFASVTTKCIETDDQKCRNSHQPKWQDRASLLITSVCQYQQLKTGKRQKLCSPGLQDGKQYWMGYIRDYRRFTAQVQSASGSSIVLKISDSKCPVGWARLAWARLAWERVDRTKSCYIRLVERQLVNEEGAEEVFVLSGE